MSESSREQKRSADNVWAEVQYRSRQWMEASTPVYTLSRNVPNYIIGVSDTHIHRRSAEGHSVDQQTTISRRMIATLWSELSRDGQTSKASITHVLRFTYALLQRSVPGIAFDPDPYFRLVLVDSDEANREFDPTADPTPGLAPLPTRTGGSGRSIGVAVARVLSTQRSKPRSRMIRSQRSGNDSPFSRRIYQNALATKFASPQVTGWICS